MKEGGEIIVIDYHHSSPRISFFLDSIIASPSAYGGRYGGCCYSIALCLVVASGAAETPFLSGGGGGEGGCIHCQKRMICQSKVADLSWSISPSDFMNWAAFLANLGRVSISSQHILPNAAFLVSPAHILFLFPVLIRHSTNRCFADRIPRLQGHSGKSKPGTFLVCRNFLRPIFSVLIWTISALAALRRPLCIFSTLLVGFGQILQSSLPVFLFDQAVSQCSEMICSNAHLTLARDLPRFCFSAVWPESHPFHFSFLRFALLHPVASFAAMSASSFSFMPLWDCIQWKKTNLPWVLWVLSYNVAFCMI